MKVPLIYELPTIPYSPVDIINRRAAATGTLRRAMASSRADYNGHHVVVGFKPYAVSGPIWNAEYFWAGRVVLGRGSLDRCLLAARREYDRGTRGTYVGIHLCVEAPEPLDLQREMVLAIGAREAHEVDGTRPDFWTGTHEAVQDALSYSWLPELLEHAKAFKGKPEEWDGERNRFLDVYWNSMERVR